MIKENLNDINKKIIEIFEQCNVAENEMLEVYRNCYNDFERTFLTKVDIEEASLNHLRDMVWYNIEYENTHDLSGLGHVFPVFMSFCDSDNYISYNEAQDLNGELIEIKRHLNKHTMYFSYMVGPIENFDDLKSKVNFVDRRSNKKMDNDFIKNSEITCFIEDEISAYPLRLAKLNSLLDVLISATEKSIKNHSRIEVNFL